jgi:hypothetical protein
MICTPSSTFASRERLGRLLQHQPVDEDDVGGAHEFGSRRRWLERVRVGSLRHDPDDLGAVADHIGGDRRDRSDGRDDLERRGTIRRFTVVAGTRFIAATRSDDDRQCGGAGDQATGRRTGEGSYFGRVR